MDSRRTWPRVQSAIETCELAVRYPWVSGAILALLNFFLEVVARPHGLLDKRNHQPSLTMERTPEAFWRIVATSAVIFLLVGGIFHLIRARRLAK